MGIFLKRSLSWFMKYEVVHLNRPLALVFLLTARKVHVHKVFVRIHRSCGAFTSLVCFGGGFVFGKLILNDLLIFDFSVTKVNQKKQSVLLLLILLLTFKKIHSELPLILRPHHPGFSCLHCCWLSQERRSIRRFRGRPRCRLRWCV